MAKISLERGDIAKCDVDAIVNAAAPALLAASCGAYGFPIHEAAPIAVAAALQAEGVDEVRFVLFSDASVQAWRRAVGSSP